MLRAVVAGHVCIDLIPELAGPVDLAPGGLVEVGPIALRPGGCVANTGRDLLALGAPARLVADAGDDEMGRVLRRVLSAAAGGAAALRLLPGESTSYSLVVQPPGGDRVFWHHVGANAQFDGAGVDLADGDLLHVGYPPVLPALAADGGAGLRALLARARASGVTTSVDLVVVDRSSEAGRHDWARILRDTLPLVDVFTPSVDDLSSALDRDFATSPEELSAVAGRLVEAGSAVVVLTAGPDGLLLRTAGAPRLRSGGPVLAALPRSWADRELWVPALPVQVASTIGAGDAATAGLLYGLLAGLEPEDAALAAAGAAALKVSGRASLPHYDDSGIAAGSVAAADRPGWQRGRRGVFAGHADSALSGVPGAVRGG
jgi:sugar/nucleoside kinase (ribokinase family)